MPWHTKVGPNYRIIINGAEIAVDRWCRISLMSSFDECEIKVIRPDGREDHIPRKKGPVDAAP